MPRRFDLKGMKLVLDCAHGATYHIAPLLFRELGADVVTIGAEPNGIKFFSAEGEKLDDATEAAIEAALDAPFFTAESDKLGKAIRTRDAVGRYMEFCKASVPRRFDLKGICLLYTSRCV